MKEDLDIKSLEQATDEVLKDITYSVGGVRLQASLSHIPVLQKPHTVYITFTGQTPITLAMCAEYALFHRITKFMLDGEPSDEQEVEMFIKEYFNVLCGKLAASLYALTHKAVRFGVPHYCSGTRIPEGTLTYFLHSYRSEQGDAADFAGYP